MRFIYATLLLLILVALGIFAVQNPESITLRFLNWSVTSPFALLAIIVYLLGMVSGWTVLGVIRRSLSRATAKPQE